MACPPSALPMIGCCGSPPPCPPDRISLIASVSRIAELEFFRAGGSFAETAEFQRCMSLLQEWIGAQQLENGFATTASGRYYPGSDSFEGPFVSRGPLAQPTCSPGFGARQIAWNARSDGGAQFAYVSVSKVRMSCVAPFCTEDIADASTGIGFLTQVQLDGGNRTTIRVGAGVYDLLPASALPVVIQAGGDPSVIGLTAVTAYARGANAQCDALLGQ